MMRRTAVAVAVSWSLIGCGDHSSPEPLIADDTGVVAPDATGPMPDVAFDANNDTEVDCRVAQTDGTVCACTEIGQRPPTLYLLLDRSDSMGENPPGSTRSKWSLVRSALLDRNNGALRALGGRLTIAMTWFPSPSSEDACNPGRHVFGPLRGSPAVYDELEAKLLSAIPRGATPTAASLLAVADEIAAMPQPAYVLLATDGAPNCGTGTCTADACTYNIEGSPMTVPGSCDATVNCCDPAATSRGIGWKACVDLEPTKAAAAKLAAAGTKVFVLGVPGTIEAYGHVLDELAVAGGAPRDGTPRYYAATEPTGESLAAALATIAAKVIDTCEIKLDAPVDDPGITNVLLDGEPIPATDGWKWTSSSTLELTGHACERIHAGKVARIQVVVGCKTVTR